MNKYYILLLIMIFLLNGCINTQDYKDYVDDYRIIISPSDNRFFTVIVPVPLYKDNLSILTNDLYFSNGSGNYSFIETEKGMGLRIESDQNIILECNIRNNNEGELYDQFSFAENPDYYKLPRYDLRFFIYAEHLDNNTLNVRITGHTYRQLGTTINGTINKNGWNEIFGKQSRVVA